MEWTLRIGATPFILELRASSVGRGHGRRGDLGGRGRGGRLEQRHGVPALGVDDDRRAVRLDHGRREVGLEGPLAVGLDEHDLELGLGVGPLRPGRRLGGDDDDLGLRLERRGLLGPALAELGSLADLLGRALGRARLALGLLRIHGLLVAAAAVEVARGLLGVDVPAGVALAHVRPRLARALLRRQRELPVVEALERAGGTLLAVGLLALGVHADLLLPHRLGDRGLRSRLDGREREGLRDRLGARHVRLGRRHPDLVDRLLARGAVADRGAGSGGVAADAHLEAAALPLLHAPVGAEAGGRGRLDLHGRHCRRRGDDHGDRHGRSGGLADGEVGGRLGQLVAAHGGGGVGRSARDVREGVGGEAEDARGEGLDGHETSKAPEREPSGSVTRSSFEREKNAGNYMRFSRHSKGTLV